MSKYVKAIAVAVVAAGLFGFQQNAQATTLTTLLFSNITNNSDINVAGQLSVEVEDKESAVWFTFLNNVGIYSSINAVYFDDKIPLLGDATIVNSAGVNFEADAKPVVLPGGVSGPHYFEVSDSSWAKKTEDGVDHKDEYLTIIFELVAGMKFDNVFAALMSGDLRIGMHVRAIEGAGDNDSDSFLNVAPIPLPAGLVLFLSGLVGIGVLGRYKAKRRELTVS
jgi:hypothetical protein